MWGGLHFFVSIETLVSFTIPSSLCHDGAISGTSNSEDSALTVKRAGNPTVRRLHFTRERRLTPVFALPNATLFLQVLFSSGNRVHLMTPWCKEDTATILKSFGWVSFLADARRISVAPGSSQFSFSSLGVDPADYTRTVLVIDDALRWSNATALQLIEVCHTNEGKDAADSMELLYALSRCIFFSEWYLRYPSSSIASCVALSNTTVFAFCRFFLEGTDTEASLMQLISSHGGRIVHTATEATHILALPPPPAQRAGSSSTTSSSASFSTSSSGDESESEGEEESGSLVDSTDTDTSDGRSDGHGSVSRHKGKERPVGDSKASCSSFGARVLETCATSPPSALRSRAAAQLTSVETPMGPNTALQAVTVTVPWVYRCIRALRLVPIDCAPGSAGPNVCGKEVREQIDPVDNSKAELASKTGTLLCALLPPPDARPLLWTTLHSIASQHGYDTTALVQSAKPGPSSKTVTAACVLEALTSPIYSDVVEVRLQPLPVTGKSADGLPTSSRSRGTPVTRHTLDSLKLSSASSELGRIGLHRFERRRDKEAVFAHLQLIASQFLYSFDYVQQRKLQALRCHAGTQTSGARHASMGTMTEGQQPVATPLEPEDDAELAKSKETAAAATSDFGFKGCKVTPAARALESKAAESITSNAAGAVGEVEWRHHLSNVEGKMLVSHVHAGTVNGKEVNERLWDGGQSISGADDGETSMKITRAAEAQAMEHAVKTEGLTTMKEDNLRGIAPPSSNILAGTSHDEPVPARPPLAPSFSKPPSSLLPLPLMPKAVEVGPGKVDALPGGFTACFIPTSVLTADQQFDFYAFLCSLPLFNTAELGNSVVRVTDGVRCQFANHKGAKDFLRIDFIEFLSLHLPIYPVLNDSVGLEDLQRTVMDFPFLPLPAAPEVSQEEAQSLWTAPPAPEPTTLLSTQSTAARTLYPSEGDTEPHRRGSDPLSVPPKSPSRRGRDSASTSSSGKRLKRSETLDGNPSKRSREDDSAKETPPSTDHYRHRDRPRSDHHSGSSSRRVESTSSSSHHHRHYHHRGDRHRSPREDSDRDSRSDVHHRLHSRRDRR
ncbi:hypothetical protein JKF63_04527 [Porcisia hertigi]|uniref:BRCT domain-containing protein n=1 Tax=Porcisia hertigi TaxID=2761500 RepID=A0A836LBZ6_9TRYP|nr:hypothetical protein JKF63_04527 [Porcisia hertigi]